MTPIDNPQLNAFSRTKLWFNSYRGQVLQRIIASVLLAYLLSNFTAIIFTLILPTEKVNATLYAAMLSFVFYIAAVIWIFTIKSTATMWRQVSLTTLGTGLLAAGLYYLRSML